jgi:hypothetical protein
VNVTSSDGPWPERARCGGTFCINCDAISAKHVRDTFRDSSKARLRRPESPVFAEFPETYARSTFPHSGTKIGSPTQYDSPCHEL